MEDAIKEDQYALMVGTLPVPREGIATGFLKQFGMLPDNAFVQNIIESLAKFIPDEIYDTLGEVLYGGAANHTYISVHKLDENGEPGQPLGTVDAMGITFDKEGNPVIDGDGNLMCVATNEETFKNHPMHDDIVNNTKSLTPLITGNKDQVYQGFATAQRTGIETFKNGPLEYSTEKGHICNAFTGEAVDNLAPACNPDLDINELKSLGAGFKSDVFNTAAGGENLTGDALMAHVDSQRTRLETIFEEHKETMTPAPERAAVEPANEIKPEIASTSP